MNHHRALALALLAPAAVAGVFSLAAFALETFDVPVDEDYARARAAIESSDYDPAHDAVAVAPAWSIRPYIELRHIEGLRATSGDDLARRPLQRFRRLFLVTEPDGDDVADALTERFGPPSRLLDGRVVVHVFQTGLGVEVTWDLAAEIKAASVSIDDADGSLACDKPHARGWMCPKRASWQRVTLDPMLVSENSQAALWVHPPKQNERLVIRSPKARLGDVLVVRMGHTRDGAHFGRAPVRVRVLVDGDEVYSESREPRFDFAAVGVPLGEHAGKTASVEVVVDSRNNAKNHFGVDVFSWRRTEGGAR